MWQNCEIADVVRKRTRIERGQGGVPVCEGGDGFVELLPDPQFASITCHPTLFIEEDAVTGPGVVVAAFGIRRPETIVWRLRADEKAIQMRTDEMGATRQLIRLERNPVVGPEHRRIEGVGLAGILPSGRSRHVEADAESGERNTSARVDHGGTSYGRHTHMNESRARIKVNVCGVMIEQRSDRRSQTASINSPQTDPVIGENRRNLLRHRNVQSRQTD